MKFESEKYIFTVSDEKLFHDHSKDGKSGHLGHGMCEYKEGCVLAFYPVNDGEKWSGHNGLGFCKMKRSYDSGETWTDLDEVYPFSDSLYRQKIDVYSAVEKAVCTKTGRIIAFNVIMDLQDSKGCGYEPFRVSSYCISDDEGKTWSDPKRFCDVPGRIYDARIFDDKIYVLILYAKDSTDKSKLMVYHLFKSEDNGETFENVSVVPFPVDFEYTRYYGTMEKLKDGSIIAYSYRGISKEYELDYVISKDDGKTWGEMKQAHFEKRIRNPQLVKFKDSFFLFGRSGSNGEQDKAGHNIIYFSDDGINFDEGHYLKMREFGAGAYSNGIIVHKAGEERLLIRMSHAYEANRTNIYSWFIDAKAKGE